MPGGAMEWLAEIGGGTVTRLDRQLARREAWAVDVTRPDGSVLEGFLRLDRNPPTTGVSALEREARVVEALASTGVPVPGIHAWDRDRSLVLYERVRGRADVDRLTDPEQQRAVMEDHIRAVARLHTLDIDGLGLEDALGAPPVTAAECALDEVDRMLGIFRGFLAAYHDPLITYSVDWLRRFVPTDVARVSLLQGDTGPLNFMFDGARVTAVVDWELAHFGDPMEDLGNISVREFWQPSGGLTGLFELYERESGIPYDRKAAQYYRVQQNVRGSVGIHLATIDPKPEFGPLALFLLYRYATDRSTCEAMAEYLGIELERPEMPDAVSEADVLADHAVFLQQHDVIPNVGNPYSAAKANEVRILVECIDRKRRYGARLAAIELDELGQLLGKRPDGIRDGLLELDAAVAERTLDDEALLRYLARRAYRDEWLYTPAMTQGAQGFGTVPERHWSPLD